MKNDGSGPKAYTTPTTAPARCVRRSVQPAHQAATKLPTTPRYKATFNTVVGEAPNHRTGSVATAGAMRVSE